MCTHLEREKRSERLRMSKYYFVKNKGDDFGNERVELVQTTERNAKEYYYYKEVSQPDVDVLKKYLYFANEDEEKERTNEERFYGQD